jgi:hypothetical protein
VVRQPGCRGGELLRVAMLKMKKLDVDALKKAYDGR